MFSSGQRKEACPRSDSPFSKMPDYKTVRKAPFLAGSFLQFAYNGSRCVFLYFLHSRCQYKHLCVFPDTFCCQVIFSVFFFPLIFGGRPVFPILFLIRGFEAAGMPSYEGKGTDGWKRRMAATSARIRPAGQTAVLHAQKIRFLQEFVHIQGATKNLSSKRREEK